MLNMLEGLLAILSVIAVICFGVYYNSYLKQSKGCTAFRVGRILSFGVTGFWALVGGKDHPAYIVAVLVFIAVTVFITILNQRDCKSWFHAVLMTVWQGLVVITIFYFLYQLSKIDDRRKKHRD